MGHVFGQRKCLTRYFSGLTVRRRRHRPYTGPSRVNANRCRCKRRGTSWDRGKAERNLSNRADCAGDHARAQWNENSANGGVIAMFRKALMGAALLAVGATAYGATDYPSGYTKCAKEGETCSFSGTRSVAYGKSGTFVYATLTGPITCQASLFPSISVGNPRYCSYSNTGSSSSSSSSSSSQLAAARRRAPARVRRAAAVAVAASPARPARRRAACRSARRCA